MAALVPEDLSFQTLLLPIIEIERLLARLRDLRWQVKTLASTMQNHEVQAAVELARNGWGFTIDFYENALWQAQLNLRTAIQQHLRYYGRLPSLDVHARHGG